MTNEDALFKRDNGYRIGYKGYSDEFIRLISTFGSWGNIPIDTLNKFVRRATGSGFSVDPNGVFMPNSDALSSF